NQSNHSAGVQEQFNAEKAGEENVQQYVLFPIWSSSFTNPQNIDDNAAFGGKEHEFKGTKPQSEVYVSPSSSAQTKKHDDKTKREAKGKILAVRQISTNSTNTFSAAGPSNTAVSPTHGNSSYVDTSFLAVGKISTNSTNTFSAAGPSNTAVSPTHGNSSYVDTSC
nr:hypothetical protein [Tanacetum cinerariifolium]